MIYICTVLLLENWGCVREFKYQVWIMKDAEEGYNAHIWLLKIVNLYSIIVQWMIMGLAVFVQKETFMMTSGILCTQWIDILDLLVQSSTLSMLLWICIVFYLKLWSGTSKLHIYDIGYTIKQILCSAALLCWGLPSGAHLLHICYVESCTISIEMDMTQEAGTEIWVSAVFWKTLLAFHCNGILPESHAWMCHQQTKSGAFYTSLINVLISAFSLVAVAQADHIHFYFNFYARRSTRIKYWM